MCSARAEAASGRFSAQQQGGGSFHEGGEELRPGRGAVQEGPGGRADHRDKVRDAHVSARFTHHSRLQSPHQSSASEPNKRLSAYSKGCFLI